MQEPIVLSENSTWQSPKNIKDFYHSHGSIWVFPKIVYPPIIHFNRVFNYKPSILGYPCCWKHPYYPPGNNHIPIASWKLESSQPLDVTSILPLEEGLARKGSLGCSRPVSGFPTETGSHVDFLGKMSKKTWRFSQQMMEFFLKWGPTLLPLIEESYQECKIKPQLVRMMSFLRRTASSRYWAPDGR